jgi:hypothetical protein
MHVLVHAVELTLLAASASGFVGVSAVRTWSRDGVIQPRRAHRTLC